MTRRNFLAASTALAASVGTLGTSRPNGAGGDVGHTTAPPRNRHPYKGINWTTAHQICGTTHVHCKTQAELDVILKRIEFLTLSNYYPSAPWYPLASMTENYYRLHHDFPVMVNGKRVEGPFDWNKIVGNWIKDLPPERQKEYPFKEVGRIFRPLPDGVLEAPNAEHHNFFDDDGKRLWWLHINAPGSMFASGTFDQWQARRFQTGTRGGYDFGSGEH